VARIEPNGGSLTRKDVLKTRQRIHFRQYKGQIYVSKWPRRRGPKKTVMQQAWVDQFTQLAKATKHAPGIEHDNAQLWTSGQGVYWRDIIHSAATGKLILSPGGMRITTPTCYLTRLTNQSVTGGTLAILEPTAKLWDNYTFWDATVNPTRLTFKESGLYMVSTTVIFTNSSSSGARAGGFRVNGTAFKGQQAFAVNNNAYKGFTSTITWFFEQGDYIEVWVQPSVTETVTMPALSCTAITPEAVT